MLKILATIMIFIGSVLLVFGVSYLLACIFYGSNPFLLAWIIESVLLTLMLFWTIYFEIF